MKKETIIVLLFILYISQAFEIPPIYSPITNLPPSPAPPPFYDFENGKNGIIAATASLIVVGIIALLLYMFGDSSHHEEDPNIPTSGNI